MINDVTPNLGLPLPHQANDLSDDVSRVRAAFTAIDAQLVEKAALVDGKVPASQLPSFVDDVLEADSFAALPVPGESGKIYVVISGGDENKQFRWSGTGYVEINPSPGSTDAVPEGSTNRYFTAQRARDAQVTASETVFGLVKVGANLVIDPDGKLSAPGYSSSTQTFEIIDIVAASGQTSFGVTGGYVVGYVQVLLNGVELMADDYTATDGVNVVLATGASAGDALRVRKWSQFNVALVQPLLVPQKIPVTTTTATAVVGKLYSLENAAATRLLLPAETAYWDVVWVLSANGRTDNSVGYSDLPVMGLSEDMKLDLPIVYQLRNVGSQWRIL